MILNVRTNMLKKRFLPNLSKIFLTGGFVSGIKRDRTDTFLYEFDQNSVPKLETLVLRGFIISAKELKILSDKLTSLQMTDFDILGSHGFTGNLSVLFTHCLPTLSTLIMSHCGLNSDDVHSLVQAEVEGKLPQLKHLDISENQTFKISDLFTDSAQWNQLTKFVTSVRKCSSC